MYIDIGEKKYYQKKDRKKKVNIFWEIRAVHVILYKNSLSKNSLSKNKK